MTHREFLIFLHQYQTFRRARKPDGGYYSAAGYFRKTADWEPLLLRSNRRVTLRMVGQPCIRCGGALSSNSTGDHIISKAQGGADGAENYLPLCGRCNSSKGTKDLLTWWVSFLGRSPADLSDDVLCAYARLLYRWHSDRCSLDEDAIDSVWTAAHDLIMALPPSEREYFQQRFRVGLLV